MLKCILIVTEIRERGILERGLILKHPTNKIFNHNSIKLSKRNVLFRFFIIEYLFKYLLEQNIVKLKVFFSVFT